MAWRIVVKLMGDGTLVEFASVSDRCCRMCVAIQRKLAWRNAKMPRV